MPTIQQQINQLKKDKETLNTMLNTMGVETTGNETFTQLTPLVGKIVTDPILQDKTITITENGTTNIVADEGYNGLNKVEVTTNIASSGGGEKPSIGFTINEFDESGYPLDVTVKGLTTIPSYMFAAHIPSSTLYGAFSRVQKYTLPDNVTKINSYAFSDNRSLVNINFADTITSIGNSAFQDCLLLTQFSLRGIKTLGTYTFDNNMALKAVWLGSSLTTTTTTIFRYCSKLTKIFIDLPRATAQSLTGFSTQFGRNNSSCQIICNDDEGFITKEEFDTIDWNI